MQQLFYQRVREKEQRGSLHLGKETRLELDGLLFFLILGDPTQGFYRLFFKHVCFFNISIYI